MNEIWTMLEPYVMSVIAALGSGGIIFAFCRIMLSKAVKKLDESYNINDNANKIVEKIAGKTLNIDVTAVTEKALRKLEKQLNEKVENIHNDTQSYKHLLALIGGALAKLKALTEEEKTELELAVKVLDKNYEPTVSEEIYVMKLEPINLNNEKDIAAENTIID